MFKHGSVDIESLEISTTDRAKVEPIYYPFTLTSEQTPEVPQGQKLYTGSCHCQAITYTVVCEEIKEVRTCNCSFCSRVRLLSFFIISSLASSLTMHE
jgi:hypothetical protein